MDDFFEKGNSENWSFATFLAKTGARTNEDFSIAKTKYISEMNRMKNLEDFKNFKQKIGRYIKEAKVIRFIDIVFDIKHNSDIFFFVRRT